MTEVERWLAVLGLLRDALAAEARPVPLLLGLGIAWLLRDNVQLRLDNAQLHRDVRAADKAALDATCAQLAQMQAEADELESGQRVLAVAERLLERSDQLQRLLRGGRRVPDPD